MHTAHLLVVALLGVALLLFLVIQRRMHAFVALLLVSVVLGLAAQWPAFDPSAVLEAMQKGMAGTLGFVAIIVGLGAMFGHLLHVSGGSMVLARGCLEAFGSERTPWALALAGFLVSIPVFFDVAFVVLVPLLYQLSKEAKRPLMSFALPLMAGLVVTHAFIPPTPGPIGVASILGAELGYVILFGLVAAIPAAIVAGPVFARFVAHRVPGKIPELTAQADGVDESNPPSLSSILLLIALPIVLILADTTLGVVLPEARLSTLETIHPLVLARRGLQLLGHPFVALLLVTLLSFRVLGTARGRSPEAVRDLATKALEPAGIIILITGAGGVLKQVMIETQVGKVLADQLLGLGLVPVLIAFVIAGLVRVMQGSATVAMLTAAGLVAPLLAPLDPSPAFRALLVIPIAAGATAFSHVNDSGFWLVSRYLGLDVPSTLGTWSTMTTIAGFVGLGVALGLSVFVQ